MLSRLTSQNKAEINKEQSALYLLHWAGGIDAKIQAIRTDHTLILGNFETFISYASSFWGVVEKNGEELLNGEEVTHLVRDEHKDVYAVDAGRDKPHDR